VKGKGILSVIFETSDQFVAHPLNLRLCEVDGVVCDVVEDTNAEIIKARFLVLPQLVLRSKNHHYEKNHFSSNKNCGQKIQILKKSKLLTKISYISCTFVKSINQSINQLNIFLFCCKYCKHNILLTNNEIKNRLDRKNQNKLLKFLLLSTKFFSVSPKNISALTSM
jgi:hypothetical protein